MKVLVAIDGSPHSAAVVREAATRQWPSGTELEILTATWTKVPWFPDPAFTLAAVHKTLLDEARSAAPKLLDSAAAEIRVAQPELRISTKFVEGIPKQVILDEAARWGADLVLVGAHGWGAVPRILLGSVSHAVALHAPCSVEIVRLRTNHTS